MSDGEFQRGTKFGWALVGIVLAGIALVGAVINVASRRFQRRSEALGERLISDFRRNYNSFQSDPSRKATPEGVAIESNRSELGEFKSVESCQIVGYIETPRLKAQCISWFEFGKVQENLVFRYYRDDNRLLWYSAKLLNAEQSQPGNQAK